ncbi:aminoglycoside phosphotransferase [Arthrobacter sp. MYb229]|uniref:phosphotransferase n=1 Tax=unclassified Arthrobacter TaxID=235627 RepID=UPI000CFD5E24|nr:MULTISPECIES: phosphotransferase [unclassified Arthrobacter]PRA03056.1 aminoglycoside phosphotransferase [Arthrobacter sp. MYb229]PRB49527.1 aminoglycoside phosphotransferase [Arthrobacter sp. MYb216]
MTSRWTTRIGWEQLPGHVRGAVNEILDSPVVEATGQQGGFSPGTADRTLTANGRRAFVKAVGEPLNKESPRIHRAEAKIAASLPDTLPVPKLIGSYDANSWVALVFEDIAGSHPQTPWVATELTVVLNSLQKLSDLEVPDSLSQLPKLHTELASDFSGWERIHDDPPRTLDPWARENLQRLRDLARIGLTHLEGQTLVHSDIRSDNILLTDEHIAILVDWPWACLGAPWFDALSVLLNVRVHNSEFDVDTIIQNHQIFATMTPECVDGFLAGMAAYFIDSARLPAPARLPTLRAFQQDQGDAAISWLRDRLSATS